MKRDRGAAAVEFALIAPVLVALVLLFVIFGRAYQVQSSLNMAAREGARHMAITQLAGEAQTLAVKAAADLGATGATADLPTCSGSPPSTTMIVRYDFNFLGVQLDLKGKGVMRCGG